MIVFAIGAVILAVVLGIFYLKDVLQSRWLARLAYSEIIMRLAVFAAAMIFIGILLIIGDLMETGN